MSFTNEQPHQSASKDRTVVPSVVKMESELCVCACVSTLHTHTHTQSHLKDCKVEWQNPQTCTEHTPEYLRKPGSFFFSFTVGLARASNQTNKVSGVDSMSLWEAYPGILHEWHTYMSVLPSVPMSISETNTRHHANHAQSRTRVRGKITTLSRLFSEHSWL